LDKGGTVAFKFQQKKKAGRLGQRLEKQESAPKKISSYKMGLGDRY